MKHVRPLTLRVTAVVFRRPAHALTRPYCATQFPDVKGITKCVTCGVNVFGPGWEQHVAGKQHQRKLSLSSEISSPTTQIPDESANLKNSNVAAPKKRKTILRCELCGRDVTSKDWDNHIKGRNHRRLSEKSTEANQHENNSPKAVSKDVEQWIPHTEDSSAIETEQTQSGISQPRPQEEDLSIPEANQNKNNSPKAVSKDVDQQIPHTEDSSAIDTEQTQSGISQPRPQEEDLSVPGPQGIKKQWCFFCDRHIDVNNWHFHISSPKHRRREKSAGVKQVNTPTGKAKEDLTTDATIGDSNAIEAEQTQSGISQLRPQEEDLSIPARDKDGSDTPGVVLSERSILESQPAEPTKTQPRRKFVARKAGFTKIKKHWCSCCQLLIDGSKWDSHISSSRHQKKAAFASLLKDNQNQNYSPNAVTKGLPWLDECAVETGTQPAQSRISEEGSEEEAHSIPGSEDGSNRWCSCCQLPIEESQWNLHLASSSHQKKAAFAGSLKGEALPWLKTPENLQHEKSVTGEQLSIEAARIRIWGKVKKRAAKRECLSWQKG